MHHDDDDVVSDEEEILHLAAALDASMTDAVTTAPTPKSHHSADSLVTGTIADHIRPPGPSDKFRTRNAKYREDNSEDDGLSGDSDFDDERSELNPTALIANGKRPRPGIRTTKYWRQKAVPKQHWHKRRAREAHIADELAHPDSMVLRFCWNL